MGAVADSPQPKILACGLMLTDLSQNCIKLVDANSSQPRTAAFGLMQSHLSQGLQHSGRQGSQNLQCLR